MELTSDSLVVATPRHVGADLGEEVILLHMESGFYFGLENVGARIWKLLQQPVQVAEIERTLREEYDVEPEKCRDEVLQLITGLVDHGLVRVES